MPSLGDAARFWWWLGWVRFACGAARVAFAERARDVLWLVPASGACGVLVHGAGLLAGA